MPEEFWPFFILVSSENCPVKDPKTLMWGYTLQEFLSLKQYVDMLDSYKTASYKDQELEDSVRK